MSSLRGGNVQFKKVSTPFQDDRIARPTKDDTEKKGILQPIASKILMKVLFAARMARFDLLRATQGLASRVTKWSVDCDQALFRLMCYIHTTVDWKMHGFVGDPSSRTRLWLFADSDHAGEHDSRSTSGCFLALIGPNTFYPLTAFSKKQTSTAMSSTEAEVIAANVALRAVGLPSSCLWEIIQSAGGGTENPTCTITPSRTSDYWINDTVNGYIVRVHNKRRTQLFVPSNDDCPVRTEALSSTRYTVQLFSDGNINLKVSRICPNDPESQTDSAWTGKTYFFMRGAGEADLGIEAKEIRDNLTDFEYVGDERVGSEGVTLMNKVLSKASFSRTTRPLSVFLKVVDLRPFAIPTRPNVLILLGWRSNSGENTISLRMCPPNFRLQIFLRSLSQMLRSGREGSNS